MGSFMPPPAASGGSNTISKVLAADESRTNNSVLTASALLFSGVAAGTYSLDGVLRCTCGSATPGLKTSMVITVAPTQSGVIYHFMRAGTGEQVDAAPVVVIPNNGAVVFNTVAGTNVQVLSIRAFVIVAAVSDIALFWAQQVANGTATVLTQGSYLNLTPTG